MDQNCSIPFRFDIKRLDLDLDSIEQHVYVKKHNIRLHMLRMFAQTTWIWPGHSRPHLG